MPKFPSEGCDAGKNQIFLQSNEDGGRRPEFLGASEWDQLELECQKAEICSGFGVGLSPGGGWCILEMKDIQILASRLPVSTGEPAWIKICLRPLRT